MTQPNGRYCKPNVKSRPRIARFERPGTFSSFIPFFCPVEFRVQVIMALCTTCIDKSLNLSPCVIYWSPPAMEQSLDPLCHFLCFRHGDTEGHESSDTCYHLSLEISHHYRNMGAHLYLSTILYSFSMLLYQGPTFTIHWSFYSLGKVWGGLGRSANLTLHSPR